MALPASPPITAQDINVELGRAPTAAFSMIGAEERALAGIPSGTIDMLDFLGKSAQSVTIVDSATVSGVSGSHTFVGLNFGTANANRVLVACLIVNGDSFSTDPITAVTIGGIACSGSSDGVTSTVATVDSYCAAGLFSAAVPTGTSGNVVVSHAPLGSMGIILLSVMGSELPYSNFVEAADVTRGISSTVNLDVPDNGIIIAAQAKDNTNDVTFTGITERSAINTVGGGRLEVAFDIGVPAATDQTITASWAVSQNRGLIAASYT